MVKVKKIQSKTVKPNPVPIRPARKAAYALYELTSTALQSEARVRKLAEKLMSGGDPAYYLSWGDSAVDAAGFVKAFEHFEVLFQRVGLDAAKRELREELMRRAMHPSRSTGQMHNLVAQAELAGYARILEKLEWCKEDVSFSEVLPELLEVC